MWVCERVCVRERKRGIERERESKTGWRVDMNCGGWTNHVTFKLASVLEFRNKMSGKSKFIKSECNGSDIAYNVAKSTIVRLVIYVTRDLCLTLFWLLSPEMKKRRILCNILIVIYTCHRSTLNRFRHISFTKICAGIKMYHLFFTLKRVSCMLCQQSLKFTGYRGDNLQNMQSRTNKEPNARLCDRWEHSSWVQKNGHMWELWIFEKSVC